MKTKYTLLAVLTGFALAISSAALRAGDDKPSGKPGKPPAGQSAEARLEKLKTDLDLTDDQTTKIKAILFDEAAALKALRDDTSLDRKDKREKMMELRKTYREKTEAVLTAEQKAKFEKLLSERRGPGGPDGEKKRKKD
ncbi:hypothetical protein Ga0100231_011905 [Opitutaceae bacterium TAV4]|uniref:Spy/CpxP family protein refolding chaperone n=1 Tax=Geminisphaera colitermitum TaxID=1148786 RepID=UPI000158CC23|nr:Spy/CpxP family protein refolding chaperone [Geminisphaera colitermitum]RRJ94922.1 hypothetical protein Ga0100231_011905 [Opitutaceae bacterium TAV4]RRJ98912.1 hypothetical protein Ga0100230_011465 [Opitutaceae bacterium TAV3]